MPAYLRGRIGQNHADGHLNFLLNFPFCWKSTCWRFVWNTPRNHRQRYGKFMVGVPGTPVDNYKTTQNIYLLLTFESIDSLWSQEEILKIHLNNNKKMLKIATHFEFLSLHHRAVVIGRATHTVATVNFIIIGAITILLSKKKIIIPTNYFFIQVYSNIE